MPRSTMLDLITLVRRMIADPWGSPQQFFTDDEVQARLDFYRSDIRYEGLIIAPSIVNTTGTSNTPQTIFADYYSKYGFWESDIVLQGTNTNTGAAWIVLTPVASELLVEQAHFQFELNVFTSGTVPGQYPPVFATGKIFDHNAAAADLLEEWAASLAGAYDVTVDGQTLRRSQLMQAKLTLAQMYRKRAKAQTTKMVREDVRAPLSTKRVRLLDGNDVVKGI